MPALGTADRIWAADIARLGAQRIVAALAVGRADRMDRREIQHVETHGADRRQTPDHVGERAVARRIVGGGARKHLVPAGEPGLRPIDIERNLRCVPAGEWPFVGGTHCVPRLIRKQQSQPAAAPIERQPICDAQQVGTHLTQRARRDRLQHVSAFLDLQCDGLSGFMLGGQIVAEGAPEIPPCLDGEAMTADPLGAEACLPAIVHDRVHCDTMPARFVIGAPEQVRRRALRGHRQ